MGFIYQQPRMLVIAQEKRREILSTAAEVTRFASCGVLTNALRLL